MSMEPQRSKVAVEEFATRFLAQMIPVTSKFSYFSVVPIAEEDLRQYLNEPVGALSPAIVEVLPAVGILLAPYLEKANGKTAGLVTFERPGEARYMLSARVKTAEMTVLALSIKDLEMADYHYQFYNSLAAMVADHWPEEAQERYFRTLREELNAEIHGEVDEKSWHLKQGLLRRQSNIRKETKLFREYARQSFEDTLTLYLHGTCCDIDVETGPRQMPSRYLRRRLELFMALFPPPDGYAVLPEQLKTR